MAGEYCTFATCGNCGRCDAEPDDYPLRCSWCGDDASEDDTYWPYCSSLCADHARADSLEDEE